MESLTSLLKKLALGPIGKVWHQLTNYIPQQAIMEVEL